MDAVRSRFGTEDSCACVVDAATAITKRQREMLRTDLDADTIFRVVLCVMFGIDETEDDMIDWGPVIEIMRPL